MSGGWGTLGDRAGEQHLDAGGAPGQLPCVTRGDGLSLRLPVLRWLTCPEMLWRQGLRPARCPGVCCGCEAVAAGL